MSNTYPQYVAVVAPQYGLPPALVTAIVKTESGGDRFAHRAEPAYRWLWDVRTNAPYRIASNLAAQRLPPPGFSAPDGISKNTEWLDQQSSWGLMQVMGAVAREQGFTGFLCGLCDPLTGLHHGCQLLAKRAGQYRVEHGWQGVIASYNAGHPGTTAGAAYVQRVLAHAAATSIEELTA